LNSLNVHPRVAPQYDIPQNTLLSALHQQVFTGDRASLGQRLTFKPSGDMIDISTLHHREKIDPIVTAYCQSNYPKNDRRAAISMWSQWYFSLLLPDIMVLLHHGQCRLHFQSGDFALICDEKFRPNRFVLGDYPVLPTSASPRGHKAWAPYLGLIDHHLSPLITALASVSGTSPKVFWMNAAVVIAYLAKTTLSPEKGLTALIADKQRPDGNRNLLCAPYASPKQADTPCKRRICCLRYMLDNVDECSTCPLVKT
jgi:ferric iron reductase protein FhuF